MRARSWIANKAVLPQQCIIIDVRILPENSKDVVKRSPPTNWTSNEMERNPCASANKVDTIRTEKIKFNLVLSPL